MTSGSAVDRGGATDSEAAADVGGRLREARAKIGMTRRQLAATSGTSERYLAHLEAGTGNPTLAVLAVLAGALDIAVADLIPMGGERSQAYAEASAMLRRLPDQRLPGLMEWIADPRGHQGSRAQRVVLVGLRGAGKSTLGSALARKLSVPFLEMSREVEAAYGGEMRLLIEIGGQSALRRYEHEAWEAILARHPAAVIATPGGIVADPILYERILATAHSVWIQATPEDHMGRVMAQGDFRPMASNRGAMEDLKAILAARSADYSRAETRLDTSTQGLEETCVKLEAIAQRLIATAAI